MVPPFPPDIEVEIRFLATNEGGRNCPAQTGYRPQFYYQGHDWDADYAFPDKEWICPGETARAWVWFLSPEWHLGRIDTGMEFQIREGSRVAGHGRVTRILNLAESAERSKQNRLEHYEIMPEPPVLLVFRGSIENIDYLSDRAMGARLGVIARYTRHMNDLHLFDGAGRKWKCAEVTMNDHPVTWVCRFASCFSSPVRSCAFKWAEPSPYKFGDVVDLLRREVAEDDDFLTQFHTEAEWNKALSGAANLMDLVRVYRRLTKE